VVGLLVSVLPPGQGASGRTQDGHAVLEKWAVSPTYSVAVLALARLCCEHESVAVVLPAWSPTHRHRGGGYMGFIALDVTATSVRSRSRTSPGCGWPVW
jgi:hypothetical protein